jgi:hypothetical protein
MNRALKLIDYFVEKIPQNWKFVGLPSWPWKISLPYLTLGSLFVPYLALR